MENKVAIVTGANQGLGYGIIENFVTYLPKGSIVYLLGRNKEQVILACEKLSTENVIVKPAVVDMSKIKQIKNFINEIKKNNVKIDYFVSNASPRMSKTNDYSQEVKTFIEVSNLNATYMIDQLINNFQTNAIITVIASSFAKYNNLDKSIWPMFNNNSHELLNKTLTHYIDIVENKKNTTKIWPKWINIVSKVAQYNAVKIFAKQHPNLIFVAINPGILKTLASKDFFSKEQFENAPTPFIAGQKVVKFIITKANKYNATLFDVSKNIILEKPEDLNNAIKKI